MTEDEDLVVDLEHEKEKEYEESEGDSEQTKREDLNIKLSFGTKLFREDQDCDECDSKADGVLVSRGEGGYGSDMDWYGVYCEDCREIVAHEKGIEFVNVDWYSFEAEA
jgi:hypothetical protein